MAIGGQNSEISVWSTATLERQCAFAYAGSGIFALAVHSGTRMIAVGARDGTTIVRSLDGGGSPRTLGAGSEFHRALAFSPDGRTIYSTEYNGVMASWLIDQDPAVRLRRGPADTWRVVPRPDGQSLAILRNLALSIEDLGEDQREAVGFPITSFADAVWAGDRVITIEHEGLRSWDSRPWPARREVGTHESWAFGVDFAPAGDRVVSASGDGTVVVRTVPEGRVVSTMPLPPMVRSRSALFIDEGSTVAAGCGDGLVRVFDAQTGEVVRTMGRPGAEVYALALRSDRGRLAAAFNNGSVALFDLLNGEELARSSGLESPARGIAYAPDGRSLYTSGSPGGVIVWDAETLERLDLLATSTEPWAVAVDPAGTRLAAGTYGAEVEFFDLRTGARSIGIGRHHQVVAGLAFSPDGRLLASGGDDGTVKLWDPESARLLASLEPGRGPVPGLAFHPSSNILGCATAGGRVQLWDLSFHRRYLGANLEYALRRFGDGSAPPESLDELRRLLGVPMRGDLGSPAGAP